MKPFILLDQDNTLFDFEGKAAELVGPDWKEEIEKPNWGRFHNFPNFFDLLEPFPDALDLYHGCVEIVGDKNRVQILTALPNRAMHLFPSVARDKIATARRHIDENIRVHFGPFAQDKQYHIRHPMDVLVDDMERNIEQWGQAGGIGILHVNAAQSLKEIRKIFQSTID